MARFSRIHVALTMQQTGLVPVFYHQDLEVCKQVLQACYAGGVRVFEFTNRGDFAHELFGALVKHAAQTMPDMILGAGTVYDAGTASLYLQLGANFIVQPVVKEDVALVCNRRKVLWAPGCGTLTEISRAEELGAEIVKMFPGFVLGPEFVSAAKGPSPWTSIMPTGGVEPTEESLTKWFKAGVTCVGIGSQLFPKKVVDAQDWQAITTTVSKAMSIIAQVRGA